MRSTRVPSQPPGSDDESPIAVIARDTPEFSWSHSRDGTLSACARQYYWHYYGSHAGWLRGAPPEARHAYQLKCLTSYELELGTLVHTCAHDMACAVRDGRSPPPLDALVARSLSALRDLYRRGLHLDLFRDAPKRHPVTRAVYYGEPQDRAATDGLKQRLRTCLAHLVAHDIWRELRAAAATGTLTMHLFPGMSSFLLDGVTVYAVPDLVFSTAEGAWVIVDWKTGRAREATDQLGIYGLFLRDGLRLASASGAYEGRVVHLGIGETDVVVLTAAMLDRAAARVRTGVAAMHGFLTDPERNVARDRGRFPLALDRRRCRRCNFLELCAPELEAERSQSPQSATTIFRP